MSDDFVNSFIVIFFFSSDVNNDEATKSKTRKMSSWVSFRYFKCLLFEQWRRNFFSLFFQCVDSTLTNLLMETCLISSVRIPFSFFRMNEWMGETRCTSGLTERETWSDIKCDISILSKDFDVLVKYNYFLENIELLHYFLSSSISFLTWIRSTS